MANISISISDELQRKLDNIMANEGIKNKSRFIEERIREGIQWRT